MRRNVGALGALMIVFLASFALAQLPRASKFTIRDIRWRVHQSGVNANGYVDSLSKSLSNWTSLDTTETISLNDVAWWPNPNSTATAASYPKFYLWSPNTSTADTILGVVQLSYDGSTWLVPGATVSGTSMFLSRAASVASQAFSALPLGSSWTPVAGYDGRSGPAPAPYCRLIVQGSGTAQSFSAARLAVGFPDWHDNTGNGQSYGRWKWYSNNDSSHPLKWDLGPTDSVAHNLTGSGTVADDVDSTTVIDLSDVDWTEVSGGSISQLWGKLYLWTDLTVSAMDSLLVSPEFSMDGVNFTKGTMLATATAAFNTPTATGDCILQVPLCGLTNNAAANAANSAYGWRYVRFLIRPDVDGVFPQARLQFAYPTRNPN